MTGNTRFWVRIVDGRLTLTWRSHSGGGERPLTWRERVAWRLWKRVPNP